MYGPTGLGVLYGKKKWLEELPPYQGGGGMINEVKERKDRVEDALNATRAAVEEGIVTGGGCALLYAAQDLEKVKAKGEDQKAGVDLVRRALEAPIRQITKNAGVDGSVVVGKLLEQNNKSQKWLR